MGFGELFGKEKKETIESHFQIDLNNISLSNFEKKGNGEYVKTLTQPELGMFDSLKIIPNKTTYTLEFVSDKNEMTKELIQFINFLANKYGLDMSRCGKVTNEELGKIQYGANFMRMWYFEQRAILITNVQVEASFFTLAIKGIKINS